MQRHGTGELNKSLIGIQCPSTSTVPVRSLNCAFRFRKAALARTKGTKLASRRYLIEGLFIPSKELTDSQEAVLIGLELGYSLA
jgi:hypothetical protein